ncbi:MAG: CBS domain-containing protein [Methanomassiliicoccales archaeon]
MGDVTGLVVKEPTQVRKSAKTRDATELMLQNSVSRKVYVVDVEGTLVGAVTNETILKLIVCWVGAQENRGIEFDRVLRDTLKEDVEQVVAKVKAVKRETKLTEALRIMIELHVNDLPVVDDDYKLIGELSASSSSRRARNFSMSDSLRADGALLVLFDLDDLVGVAARVDYQQLSYQRVTDLRD